MVIRLGNCMTLGSSVLTKSPHEHGQCIIKTICHMFFLVFILKSPCNHTPLKYLCLVEIVTKLSPLISFAMFLLLVLYYAALSVLVGSHIKT